MTASIRFLAGEKILSMIGSALPRPMKKVLVSLIARPAGISSFQYEGPLGTFLGASEDNGVFIQYVLFDDWAPEIQFLLTELVQRGGIGTYLDIGANIGLTAVPIAKKTGIACHAFEMEDRNFRYLSYNIGVNGVGKHVTAHHCALYSEDTELEMEICDENRGDHRLRMGIDTGTNSFGENVRRTRKVAARRLDSILSADDLAGPVVMKVDVQGAEVHVLRGAGKLLSNVEFLVLEFWPYGLARQGHKPEELLELVAGFPFGAVLKDGEPPPPLSPIEQIFHRTRSIPADGSSIAHMDLFLARRRI